MGQSETAEDSDAGMDEGKILEEVYVVGRRAALANAAEDDI